MPYRARLASTPSAEGPVVEFHYDYSSPYSYLASTQIEALAARTGATVELRPFVLGAVFKSLDKPAGLLGAPPEKQRWQLADLQEWAEHYAVPFRFPSTFPFNAIRAMRQTLAAEAQGLGWEHTRAAFHAYWVDDRDLTDPAVLADLAASIGIDGAELAARAEQQDIKDRLRSYTDSAIARGAFGAPTFFVDGRLYFGNDRLHFLEQALLRRRASTTPPQTNAPSPEQRR